MPGFTLAPGADAAAAALSELERTLGDVSRSVADRVVLAVGELAANCVEHGRGEVAISWRTVDGGVHVDVLGPGPDAAQIQEATLPPDAAVRGRGLFLIRTLATSVESVPGGLQLHFQPEHDAAVE